MIKYLTILISSVLVVSIAVSGCKKASPVSSDPEAVKSTSKSAASGKSEEQLMTVAQIQKFARSWSPIFQNFYGKPAPDFSFTDINGKSHTLSNYKGKNIIIIYWATWCGPCRAEVPHLIDIRSHYSEDQLAMFALSNEDQNKVKKFAQSKNMNYDVGAVPYRSLPMPFNSIQALPTILFVDQAGNFKMAAAGKMSSAEIKAVLAAKE